MSSCLLIWLQLLVGWIGFKQLRFYIIYSCFTPNVLREIIYILVLVSGEERQCFVCILLQDSKLLLSNWVKLLNSFPLILKFLKKYSSAACGSKSVFCVISFAIQYKSRLLFCISAEQFHNERKWCCIHFQNQKLLVNNEVKLLNSIPLIEKFPNKFSSAACGSKDVFCVICFVIRYKSRLLHLSAG